MSGNPIFDMMNNSGQAGTGSGGFMGLLNNRFGNIMNAMKQLNMFLGNKGIDPEQMARENLKGKTFSNETIEQFRQFARQSGMSDQQIDEGLRRAGIIK